MNKELAIRIDEILCYIWDPIGVSADALPQTRDEYSSYVPEVLSAVTARKSSEEIAGILNKIVSERMGIKPDKIQSDKVARIILEWADYLRNSQ